MNKQQLKNSILQWAIQGKLVPQIASEGTAEDLLKEIRKEKERLVKEGKLKKKELEVKPIAEDEVPFEVPESWMWVRLGELFTNRAGLAYNKESLDDKTEPMVRVLRGGNIEYGFWRTKDDDVLISSKYVNDELYLKRGTFITPAVTSLEQMGKTALVEEDQNLIVVGGFVLMLSSLYKEEAYLRYLSIFFGTSYYKEFCKSICNKSGQAFYNLGRSKLMQTPVPLPPLAEQKRIVAKIEEAMNMVKRIMNV